MTSPLHFRASLAEKPRLLDLYAGAGGAPTRKPLWRLHYYGNAAFETARILYPYLCEPKQAQISAAVEAVEDVAA